MKYLLVFVLGLLTMTIPDCISLYSEHVVRKYQIEACNSRGIGPNDCHFDMYFYTYKDNHPVLNKASGYFMLGEGPLYWVLSKRCTNKIFYNPDATKDSGKITMREYFRSRCSDFMIDASDLIFGDKQ